MVASKAKFGNILWVNVGAYEDPVHYASSTRHLYHSNTPLKPTLTSSSWSAVHVSQVTQSAHPDPAARSQPQPYITMDDDDADYMQGSDDEVRLTLFPSLRP